MPPYHKYQNEHNWPNLGGGGGVDDCSCLFTRYLGDLIEQSAITVAAGGCCCRKKGYIEILSASSLYCDMSAPGLYPPPLRYRTALRESPSDVFQFKVSSVLRWPHGATLLAYISTPTNFGFLASTSERRDTRGQHFWQISLITHVPLRTTTFGRATLVGAYFYHNGAEC